MNNYFSRYIFGGAVLFLVDFLVTSLLFLVFEQTIYISQLIGRLCGATAGLPLHSRFTFRHTIVGKSLAWRYGLVTIGLWIASPFILAFGYSMAGEQTRYFLTIKISTDVLLVVLSFLMLKYFVFAQEIKQH